MSNVVDRTMPDGSTVDVRCGGAMPHVGCMPKDVGAMPKGVGNIPKGRQYTKVGHSMTTLMRQMFGLTMATPMGRYLVLS